MTQIEAFFIGVFLSSMLGTGLWVGFNLLGIKTPVLKDTQLTIINQVTEGLELAVRMASIGGMPSQELLLKWYKQLRSLDLN